MSCIKVKNRAEATEITDMVKACESDSKNWLLARESKTRIKDEIKIASRS